MEQKNNSVSSAETKDEVSANVEVSTSAPIMPNPMLADVLSQDDYIKELEGLVCALASCYEKCKKTYFDKHLHTASRQNKDRRDLNEQEQSEIGRFPLIQGTANQFAVEKLSKSNKKPTKSLTQLATLVIASKHKTAVI